MPRPRRSNLSQRTRNAIRHRNIASQLSDEERAIARENRRVSMQQRRALIRATQRQEQREAAHKTARNEANTVVEEDDDCVAIVELIEINDDEEPHKQDKPPDLKRSAAEDSIPGLPLKIPKIKPLNLYSDDSADAELLPRHVDSYKDALRLLKPLEEFALLEENYRAIGLLIQLEKIFERRPSSHRM